MGFRMTPTSCSAMALLCLPQGVKVSQQLHFFQVSAFSRSSLFLADSEAFWPYLQRQRVLVVLLWDSLGLRLASAS